MGRERLHAPRAAVACKLAAVAFWLILWQVASMLVGNAIILCGPLDALASLAALVPDALFWRSIANTMLGVLAGFLCAFASGVALGALGARFRALHVLLEPAVSFMKSVPVVCVIVLLLIWLGSSRSVCVVVALVAFPPAYAAAFEGAGRADPRMRELLEVQGVPLRRRILAFWWPSILPYLKASARAFVGMSWKAGIAAELIGIPLGTMGAQVYQAKITLSTSDLFAWTFAIVALSVACERAFLWLLEWSGRASLGLAIPRAPRGRAGGSAPAAMAAGGEPLISLKDAAVAFEGEPRPLFRVTACVRTGDALVLDQASGTGKTTLLRAAMGLRDVSSGSVARAPGTRISAVFQEALLFDGLSAVDNVRLFAGDAIDAAGARELLSRVLPGEALERPVSALSGGQRRRVELCRALACDSDAVLLDEPFSGLDRQSVRACLGLIDERLGGRALVIATHCAAAGARWPGRIGLQP